MLGVVLAALALGIAGVFLVVAASSRRDVAYPRVQSVGYWIRARWLAFLVALLVVVVGTSLFFMPYAGGQRPTVEARAVGAQFSWTITPDHVPAGTRVRFSVTSADVNHGFGLYDPHGKLLGSVQAMPGYTNRLTVTLDEPGRYLVSCLEFCGVGHHVMANGFRVTPR